MYILFLVQKMMRVKQITRGGWSGLGMATVGIDPNTFEVLIGHPTKIPTDRILGDVVQNCRIIGHLALPPIIFHCHRQMFIYLRTWYWRTYWRDIRYRPCASSIHEMSHRYLLVFLICDILIARSFKHKQTNIRLAGCMRNNLNSLSHN